MSTEKPSRNEEEYFARQDAELLRRERATLEHDAAEAERRSHRDKCPRCGHDLHGEAYHGVPVRRCGHCGGVWLDAAALDQIAGHDDPGILGRVFADLSTALRGQKHHA
jgi:hypothetical protein